MNAIRKMGIGLILVGVGFAGGAWGSVARDHLGKITGAAKHLDAAQMSLNEAGDDFGGHRSKAVALITQAQNELKQAADWAKSH
jgi:hypothetical protein